MDADDQPSPASNRLLHLCVASLLGTACAGFLVATRGRPQDVGVSVSSRTAKVQAATGGPAVSYAERPVLALGPNRGWPQDLRTQLRGRASPLPRIDPEARRASLARRASRRAYAGAPPVIPHAVDPRRADNCLACHGQGLRLGKQVVPRMSHRPLTQCFQCHVQAGRPGPADASNTFQGEREPEGGERAWKGAPPGIPHSTLMRNDCLTCHGPSGRPGIQTTHPQRQSCRQCHFRSAVLDQEVP